jgi:hypothetical protein
VTPDTVTRWGHATVAMRVAEVRLVTDPLLRRRVAFLRWAHHPPPPSLAARTDAVLVSYPHRDHLDLASLAAFAPGTRWLVPVGSGSLVRRVARGPVTELAVGDAVSVNGVPVRATHAEHDGRRGASARSSERWDRRSASSLPPARRLTSPATPTSSWAWPTSRHRWIWRSCRSAAGGRRCRPAISTRFAPPRRFGCWVRDARYRSTGAARGSLGSGASIRSGSRRRGPTSSRRADAGARGRRRGRGRRPAHRAARPRQVTASTSDGRPGCTAQRRRRGRA